MTRITSWPASSNMTWSEAPTPPPPKKKKNFFDENIAQHNEIQQNNIKTQHELNLA
jgi:hypothetical protein